MHFIKSKIRALESQLQKIEEEKSVLQGELAGAQRELEKLEKETLKQETVEKSEFAKNSKKSIFPIIERNFIERLSFLSAEEKIKIFMNLFRGRPDVFPKSLHNILRLVFFMKETDSFFDTIDALELL